MGGHGRCYGDDVDGGGNSSHQKNEREEKRIWRFVDDFVI